MRRGRTSVNGRDVSQMLCIGTNTNVSKKRGDRIPHIYGDSDDDVDDDNECRCFFNVKYIQYNDMNITLLIKPCV